VLVLTHEDDTLIAREGENDAEAARFAHEIIVHHLPARKLDRVAPQPQVPRLNHELGLNNFPGVAVCVHSPRILAREQRLKAGHG